jgi:hypothetical protein
MEPEVLFEEADGIGTIILNRPRTLNALTMNMIAEMRTRFTAWLADDAVKAVVIKGAGDRAFCAGGDVRAVRQSIIEYDGDANPELAQEFFYEEYILNHQIHTSRKPYIALIDRVCMGGGVGLSVHGSFRIATERTRVGRRLVPLAPAGRDRHLSGADRCPRDRGRLRGAWDFNPCRVLGKPRGDRSEAPRGGPFRRCSRRRQSRLGRLCH